MGESVAFSFLRDDLTGSIRSDSILFSVQKVMESGQCLRSILLRASTPFDVRTAFFPALQLKQHHDPSVLTSSMLLDQLLNGKTSALEYICLKIFPVDLLKRLVANALNYEGIKHFLELCHGFIPSVECVVLDAKADRQGENIQDTKVEPTSISKPTVALGKEDVSRIESALKLLREVLMDKLTNESKEITEDTSSSIDNSYFHDNYNKIEGSNGICGLSEVWDRLIESFELSEVDGCGGISARIKDWSSSSSLLNGERNSKTEVRLLVDVRRTLELACARRAEVLRVAQEKAKANANAEEGAYSKRNLVFRSIHDPSRELTLPADLLWPLLILAEGLGCIPVAMELTHALKDLASKSILSDTDESLLPEEIGPRLANREIWESIYAEWRVEDKALSTVAALHLQKCLPKALSVPSFVDSVRQLEADELQQQQLQLSKQRDRIYSVQYKQNKGLVSEKSLLSPYSSPASSGDADTTREDEDEDIEPISISESGNRHQRFDSPTSSGTGVHDDRGQVGYHIYSGTFDSTGVASDSDSDSDDGISLASASTSSDESERPLSEGPSLARIHPLSFASQQMIEANDASPVNAFPSPPYGSTLTKPDLYKATLLASDHIEEPSGKGPYSRIDELVAQRRLESARWGKSTGADSGRLSHISTQYVHVSEKQEDGGEEVAREKPPDPISLPKAPSAPITGAEMKNPSGASTKQSRNQVRARTTIRTTAEPIELVTPQRRIYKKPPLPSAAIVTTGTVRCGKVREDMRRTMKGAVQKREKREKEKEKEKEGERSDEASQARLRALMRVKERARRNTEAMESAKAEAARATLETREQRRQRIGAYIQDQRTRCTPTSTTATTTKVRHSKQKAGLLNKRTTVSAGVASLNATASDLQVRSESIALRNGWDSGYGDGTFEYTSLDGVEDISKGRKMVSAQGDKSSSLSEPGRNSVKNDCKGNKIEPKLFPNFPSTPPRDEESALSKALGIPDSPDFVDTELGMSCCASSPPAVDGDGAYATNTIASVTSIGSPSSKSCQQSTVQLSPAFFASPERLAVQSALHALQDQYQGLSHSPVNILPSPSACTVSHNHAHFNKETHHLHEHALTREGNPSLTARLLPTGSLKHDSSHHRNNRDQHAMNKVSWYVLRARELPEALGACMPYVVLEWGTLGRASTQAAGAPSNAPYFGARLTFRSPEVDQVSGEVLSLLDEGHSLVLPDGREVPVYVPPLKVLVYSKNLSVSDELLAETTLPPDQVLTLMQSCEIHSCCLSDPNGRTSHAGLLEIQFQF